MARTSFFESKNYPTIMFLAITIFSIIVLFGFVDFVDDVDKGFTAYVVAQQNITPELPINITEELEPEREVYTIQAWSIFYTIIITVIIFVALSAIVLKNTIKKNIKEEDKQREAFLR